MLPVFLVALPVFALILAGWIARRTGILGPNATTELNRFVVCLGLPALLFDIVAKARWRDIWKPGFIAAFGLGCAIVFVVTVIIALRSRRHLADAAVEGLNSAYANTGFMGFPLALAVIGPAAMSPALVSTILTVCVLFAIALVLIESGLQVERHPARMIAKVAMAIARNPLIAAPALGAVVLATGLKLPDPADVFLKLLGGAASPCALVALGLFLAEERPTSKPVSRGRVAMLVALKLVAQPLATWILATWVFHLEPTLTRTAVLLAALPTGTGPFMIAEFYGREAGVTSRVIMISTILSLPLIALCLSWL